jgi:hypothetical protein
MLVEMYETILMSISTGLFNITLAWNYSLLLHKNVYAVLKFNVELVRYSLEQYFSHTADML